MVSKMTVCGVVRDSPTEEAAEGVARIGEPDSKSESWKCEKAVYFQETESAPARVGQEYPLRSSGREARKAGHLRNQNARLSGVHLTCQEPLFFFLRREWGMASKNYLRKMNVAVTASEEAAVVIKCKGVQNRRRVALVGGQEGLVESMR